MLVRANIPRSVGNPVVAASALQAGMIRGLRRPAGLAGTEQAIMSTASIAGSTLSAAAGLHVGWATAAIPVVGPIIAGVTIALSLLFARKGPKQKVATTKIVEAVIPELQKNLAAYQALPVHYYSAQQQALANFDAGWQYIVDHCQIPEMGDPGQRCVTERQRGGKYDMFRELRDPISNDPDVKPDPSALDSLLGSASGSDGGVNASALVGGLDLSGLLLPAGLLLLAGLL